MVGVLFMNCFKSINLEDVDFVSFSLRHTVALYNVSKVDSMRKQKIITVFCKRINSGPEFELTIPASFDVNTSLFDIAFSVVQACEKIYGFIPLSISFGGSFND